MAIPSLRSSGQCLKRSALTFLTARDPVTQCLAPRLSRSMATEVQLSESPIYNPFAPAISRRPPPPVPEVLATVYSFPDMEPLRFTNYPANHLHLPLRRDILHQAVVYEASCHRGMRKASTKWRGDVHGGNRKVRPQKGSGRARIGNSKSPILRGGGVAFGPHPRDMSTKMPRKIYDLAWRIALSYRYRRGELIIVQKVEDLEMKDSWWIEKIMQHNHWGNEDGRSVLVTRRVMPNLFEALNGSKGGQPGAGRHGRVKEESDIDVKDLLELGRIVIEKRSLDSILKKSQLSSCVDRIGRYLSSKPSSSFKYRDLSPRIQRAKNRGSSLASKKISYHQSHKYDSSTAIDVLTTVLYTSKPSAELALANWVIQNAFESKDTEPCCSRSVNKSMKMLIHSADKLQTTITKVPIQMASDGPITPKEVPGDDPDDVLFNAVYGVRTIELNRPKKLNSLNASMAHKIIPRLLEWQKSQLATMILIGGAGPKAFCAGGDVAELAKQNTSGPEGKAASTAYFGLEYQLDHLLATYPKPYIAYMDGITMGGGVGLSMHAPIRIATERTLFAMPETTIGFFPDVGGSFFLPRLEGRIGTYLALTSERLKGVNAFYAGVATHYIDSSTLSSVTSRLGELEFKDYDDMHTRLAMINATIAEYDSGLPHDEPILLAGELRKAIDRCFKHDTMEQIINALEHETQKPNDNDTNYTEIRNWATRTLKTLHERSPTSLKVTLKQMRKGRHWSIAEAFQHEHNIAAHFMSHPDFVNGVSARLIHKPPTTPIWSPPKLSDVTPAQVDEFFTAPQGQDRLELLGARGQRPYQEYPFKMGLPREEDVEDVVRQGGMSKSAVVKKLVDKHRGRTGVREKVLEVIARCCRGTEHGLEWIDPS